MKRIFEIAVGLLLSAISVLILISVAEFISLRLNLKNSKQKHAACQKDNLRPHPVFGKLYRPDLSNVLCVEINDDGKIIWAQPFSTDSQGRRRSAPSKNKGATQAALFFGDSLTFGRGLADQETLPSAFAQLQGEMKSYNYGIRGRGVSELYAWVNAPELTEGIAEVPTLGIYSFIVDHYARLARGLYKFRGGPEYVIEEGKLVFKGIYETNHPWREIFFKALESSQTVRALGIDQFPSGMSRGNQELFCVMLTRSRDAFLQRFPGSRFVVIAYRESEEFLYPEELALEKCARENQITVLPFHLRPDSEMRIPMDGHPTALANQRTASALLDLLNQTTQ